VTRPATHRLGLRFQRTDLQLLRFLAERVRGGELGGQAANTFEQAARAAETGEPLEVFCDDPAEVAEMAALYVLHGVSQPVIEELAPA
jgi:hypothetical protein